MKRKLNLTQKRLLKAAVAVAFLVAGWYLINLATTSHHSEPEANSAQPSISLLPESGNDNQKLRAEKAEARKREAEKLDLARTDPTRAVKELSTADRQKLAEELLEAFAEQDPEQAGPLINGELFKSQIHWPHLISFFKTVAKQDLPLALRMHSELPPNDLCGSVARELSHFLCAKDPSEAIAWVSTLDDYESEGAIRVIVDYLNDNRFRQIHTEAEMRKYVSEIEDLAMINEDLHRNAKRRLKIPMDNETGR